MCRKYNAISKSNKLVLSLNGKLAMKQRKQRTSRMFDANIKSVRGYVSHQALKFPEVWLQNYFNAIKVTVGHIIWRQCRHIFGIKSAEK